MLQPYRNVRFAAKVGMSAVTSGVAEGCVRTDPSNGTSSAPLRWTPGSRPNAAKRAAGGGGLEAGGQRSDHGRDCSRRFGQEPGSPA